ncbi:MAG: hypothetical protein ACW98A_09860 [Candidatus Hodarchaeales archaeon]
MFLLNFEDIKKENITRLFSIIHQNLTEKNLGINFQINSSLERKFLEVILRQVNSNTSIMKHTESILVANNKMSFQLDFYSIDFVNLDNKDSFLHNFINIVNNFNRKGYLIFNFLLGNDNEIKFSLYFASKIITGDESSNIDKQINEFFNYNVMIKHDIKIKEFHCYLWRKGISNNHFLFKDHTNLFLGKNSVDSHDLSKFNQEFEKSLLKNNIKFIRFSKYLLFIEQCFLFLVMSKINSGFIQRIIKKYLDKYFIYILLLNKEETKQILEIEGLESLKNVQVLNSDEISNFDYNKFKIESKYS